MANHRDDVRASRRKLNQMGLRVGINLDPERAKANTDQRTLTFDTLKLINDQTPRANREQMQVDDPPAGAFNGANTSFVLTIPVAGQNIHVIWGDSTTPQTLVLARSNGSPPLAGQFFFDPNDPTVIVVGNPPQVADRLVAVYLVQR